MNKKVPFWLIVAVARIITFFLAGLCVYYFALAMIQKFILNSNLGLVLSLYCSGLWFMAFIAYAYSTSRITKKIKEVEAEQ